MPNPLATWNPDRDCWETEVVDIFGHSDVYSETWPTSGMTRNGTAYALPTWAHPTSGSASSSSPPAEMLPTPGAADGTGGRVSSEMGGTRESGAKRSITLATAVHHRITSTGAPTPPPSTDGSNFEDQPLPIEEA